MQAGLSTTSSSSTVSARARETLTQATGLTPTGFILAGTFAGCWLLARIVAGRPLFLFSYLLLVMLALAFVAGRRGLPVEGKRSDARPRLAEGETVTMEVALTANRRLSTFILEERVPTA